MADAPKYLLLGQLRREYIITAEGKVRIDQPGGNLLYAATGLALWKEHAGLIARVGEDYPRAWLEKIQGLGFEVSGVRILPEAHDLRAFIAYSDLHTRHTDDPVGHFARLEKEFPKSLLGYKDNSERIDDMNKLAPLSLRQTDVPEDYKYASAAHLCPLDYMAHSLMPAVLRQSGLTTITMDPSPGYMNSSFFYEVPALLTGLTAFLPSEDDVRALFQGRSDDLWEMAEALAAYGCDIIVIKRGVKGQYLYDAVSKIRYDIPAYPSRKADSTGAGDAFSGGFLVGYRRAYDPLQAVLHGNVSASLAIEGSGPFYALESLPGLAEARLETLPELVRKV